MLKEIIFNSLNINTLYLNMINTTKNLAKEQKKFKK